jgi:hypothetical protein
MLCDWEKVEVCLEEEKNVQFFWGENSYCLVGNDEFVCRTIVYFSHFFKVFQI